MLKNFRTYHLAKEFYEECETIKCKAHIKDQLSRASLSVVLNIAEGSGKYTVKDRAKFYRIALGSFRESQAVLDLLGNKTMLAKYDYLGICLYNLHRYTLNPRSRAT
jgi:four helix bundle protein